MQALPSRRIARRFLEPELQPRWQPRWRAVLSNLRAAMVRVQAVRPGEAVAYFRDAWVEFPFPRRAMVASVAVHIALAYFPFPEVQGRVAGEGLPLPQIQYTLYFPPRDLPAVRPPGPPGKSGSRQREQVQPPKLGADAYHPRQTIVSRPLRPTHPRQTLIQPDAPPEAPKILPPLPNIVEWNDASQPVRPRLSSRALSAQQARARPRELAEVPEVSTPQVAAAPTASGDIPIAAAPTIEQPRLTATPLAGTRAGPARSAGPDAEEAPNIAPELSGIAGSGRRLIALSATPAPPAPEIQVPPGNLEANLTIGPAGTQPGVPWGVPGGSGTGSSGNGTGTGASGSGSGSGSRGTGPGGDGPGSGPPGITISGGNPTGGAGVSGPARPGAARPLPERPTPKLDLSMPERAPTSAENFDRVSPGSAAEQVLGPKRIYTLHVNMPNLTSVTGSWVLRFAELSSSPLEAPGGIPRGALAGDDLAGPVPMRKVDPRYPPALFSAKVEGEVILYAIIRQDGSVDSIQVIKSLEPELDRNAMEALARWRFKPAERAGQPVDLEAVVTIPFRATAPL
jgi:TonB family protein